MITVTPAFDVAIVYYSEEIWLHFARPVSSEIMKDIWSLESSGGIKVVEATEIFPAIVIHCSPVHDSLAIAEVVQLHLETNHALKVNVEEGQGEGGQAYLLTVD